MKKVILALFIATVLCCRYFNIDSYLSTEHLMASLEAIQGTSPFVYIVFLALVPVFFLPTFPAVIVAGYLYDPLLGFIYAMFGASLGASLSFLFGRYLIGDKMREKLIQYLERKSHKRIDDYMNHQGWKMVLIFRLIPIFPFTPLNYALGLSGVSFRHYLYGTIVGMAPACAIFIFFSASLTQILKTGFTPQLGVATCLVLVLSTCIHFGIKKYR